MNTCRFVDCRRAPVKDGNRCADHQLRWLPRQPVERPIEPAWRTWTREHRNAKELGGGSAA